MPIYWNTRSYTKEEFVEAWSSSNTIAECARKLNLTIYGSTYRTLKHTADELSLTKEHMTGQGWSKGQNIVSSNKRPLEDILVENSDYTSSYSLKKRLLSEGLLVNKCYAPYCTTRLPYIDPFSGEEAELPLSLDHINGINNDHRLENLRLLCYNCHGMTTTYCRGPNKTKNTPTNRKNKVEHNRKKYAKARKKDICLCGSEMSIGASQCYNCYTTNSSRTKIKWPPIEEIIIRLKESNFTIVARDLGVSDNAVRKYVRKYGYSTVTLDKL